MERSRYRSVNSSDPDFSRIRAYHSLPFRGRVQAQKNAEGEEPHTATRTPCAPSKASGALPSTDRSRGSRPSTPGPRMKASPATLFTLTARYHSGCSHGKPHGRPTRHEPRTRRSYSRSGVLRLGYLAERAFSEKELATNSAALSWRGDTGGACDDGHPSCKGCLSLRRALLLGADDADRRHVTQTVARDRSGRKRAACLGSARRATSGDCRAARTGWSHQRGACPELRTGEIVLVPPGSWIPADGIVLEGESKLTWLRSSANCDQSANSLGAWSSVAPSSAQDSDVCRLPGSAASPFLRKFSSWSHGHRRGVPACKHWPTASPSG